MDRDLVETAAALQTSPLEDAFLPERLEASEAIERAEAALDARDYADVPALLKQVRPTLAVLGLRDLELRALLAESWAQMYLGEIEKTAGLLERARDLAESEGFTDVDRAEVLYRLGCCRVKENANTEAVQLLTVALELCDRSGLACDRLRSNVFEWRSRCYRNQRDFDAAWADAERALELAKGLADGETLAHAYFQASLVAERTGQWLMAQFYAEKAKELYEQAGDPESVGRLFNNLGGLAFLLGRHEEAISCLKESFRIALGLGNDVDAGYAVSSLAQVNLRTGNAASAEEQAGHALRLLGDRIELIEEVGNAQLVLGRALVEQGRFGEAADVLGRAEETFERFGSTSHRAAAWIAQGDLARRCGDLGLAADLYQHAAEALQDFHF